MAGGVLTRKKGGVRVADEGRFVRQPEGWFVRKRGGLRPVLEKYRKYCWCGWYIGWEWRYRCGICGQKGLTAYGAYNHLLRHEIDGCDALMFRDCAPDNPVLEERLVRVGMLRFRVGEEQVMPGGDV